MRHLRLLLAGGVVLAAGALAGTAAAADAPTTEPPVNGTTIKTCVNLTNGNIRVINVAPTDLHWKKIPALCKRGEQELDWTVGGGGGTGPTGPAGPARPAGPNGSAGPGGATRPAGPAGGASARRP